MSVCGWYASYSVLNLQFEKIIRKGHNNCYLEYSRIDTWECTVCGLDHSGSQPFNHIVETRLSSNALLTLYPQRLQL